MIKDFQRYLLTDAATIKDALIALDKNSDDDILTLIVVASNGVMQGSVTDGDIRRGLIQGKDLSENITSVMHTSFKFIDADNKDVSLIKELKENIPALKDFDVALGNVPIDYGIIEQSNTVKTKDPESRHCSFWKFENVKNFNELAKNFTKIEYKVETC